MVGVLFGGDLTVPISFASMVWGWRVGEWGVYSRHLPENVMSVTGGGGIWGRGGCCGCKLSWAVMAVMAALVGVMGILSTGGSVSLRLMRLGFLTSARLCCDMF